MNIYGFFPRYFRVTYLTNAISELLIIATKVNLQYVRVS